MKPQDPAMEAAIAANVKLQKERAKKGSAAPVVNPHSLGPVTADDAVEDESPGNEWDEELHGPRLTFDPVNEKLSGFLARINEAKINGDEWIEARPEIIKHFTKRAPTPYLMYEGIKVYAVGTREQIEAEESMSIDDRLNREHQRALAAKTKGVSA